jgi:hypothetical protein
VLVDQHGRKFGLIGSRDLVAKGVGSGRGGWCFAGSLANGALDGIGFLCGKLGGL